RGFAGFEAVGRPYDEQRGEAAHFREAEALVGAEDHQGGGVGVGDFAAVVEHADGGEVVLDGAAGARVDGVGYAAAALFEVVAVVAGGGEGAVAQGDDALDGAGFG